MFTSVLNLSETSCIVYHVWGEEILIPINNLTPELKRCRNRKELESSILWSEYGTQTQDRVDFILWDIFCNHPVVSHYQKTGQMMPEWFMRFEPKFDNIIKQK